MIKTRITDLFQIKHPIMLAGMSWVTEPNLVAAVSNAGGLGILGCAHLPPEETGRKIAEIRALTDKPFGINQSLIRPWAKKNIEVAIAEKVPVINYAMGRPWFIEQVHEYGGKVVGTIAIAKHAVKSAEMGVDAIVVTGHEAAAHGGAATSLVLIPVVSSQVKLPLIAAGGFSDGAGLAAALALGADAISMGTRFAVTQESMVHEHFKQMVIKSTEQDTLYSDVFDGLPNRVLKSPAADEQLKGKFALTSAAGSAFEVKRMLRLSLWDFILTSLKMMRGQERLSILGQARQAAYVMAVEKAIHEGDEQRGVLPAGQACGAIKDLPASKDLIERIVGEAEQILRNMPAKCYS